MDFITKLFTRCMACAVMATPFCLFSSIDVPKTEQLSNVSFDLKDKAEVFKKEVDEKVEKAAIAYEKKSMNRNAFLAKLLVYAVKLVAFVLMGAALAVFVMTFGAGIAGIINPIALIYMGGAACAYRASQQLEAWASGDAEVQVLFGDTKYDNRRQMALGGFLKILYSVFLALVFFVLTSFMLGLSSRIPFSWENGFWIGSFLASVVIIPVTLFGAGVSDIMSTREFNDEPTFVSKEISWGHYGSYA